MLILPFRAVASDADTIKPKITRQWTLSADFTDEIPVNLDTSFNLFQRYRVTDKYSDFNAYPGSYGLPLSQINFFDRDWEPDRYLYAHYLPFMHTPANTLFVNTQVPFTELVWTNGGARSIAEQTFRVRHSQNVNRKLNFGIIWDIVYNLGQYNYQKAADKTFMLHSSYNGDNYNAYFSTGINNLLSYENGGITGEEYLPDYSPENVPVNLNNAAQSVVKNRHFLLVQRYSPGSGRDSVTGELTRKGPVTFSHIGLYELNKRRYFDSNPQSGFYDTVMISKTETQDSLYQGILYNTLRIDFAAGRSGRFRIGAGAGIRSELRHYSQVVPGDTLTRPDTVDVNKSSLVLTGKVFNNIGEKFGWWASGDMWFQGYRAGDLQIKGRIFKDFSTVRGNITWDATGSMASITPSYWYSSWGSNNFSWQSDPGKEFRISVGSSLLYPGRNIRLKFNYAIIDNYIYMGADAQAAQHSGGLSVASLLAEKGFKVWKLHWDNTVLLQKSSNNSVVSLPLVTAKSAFFLDHTLRFKSTGGEIHLQLGGEVYIHTRYNAMCYMPATGRYFSQTEEETGNYPFVNVFLNFKLKRTRVFVMADHVNSGLTGYDYFLIPAYPMNIRMIRYGLAWTFYN